MKITKSQLKQIIKEELSSLKEAKKDHIQGIIAKIERLEKAIEDLERGIENIENSFSSLPGSDRSELWLDNAYTTKKFEIINIENKIGLLLKQLEQLKKDSPGTLARPGDADLNEVSIADVASMSDVERLMIVVKALGMMAYNFTPAALMAITAASLQKALGLNNKEDIVAATKEAAEEYEEENNP